MKEQIEYLFTEHYNEIGHEYRFSLGDLSGFRTEEQILKDIKLYGIVSDKWQLVKFKSSGFQEKTVVNVYSSYKELIREIKLRNL